MWTYRFAEDSGYDCMTDGVWIEHNGRSILQLDGSDFGQNYPSQRDYGADGDIRRRMEELAEQICTALNTAAVKFV